MIRICVCVCVFFTFQMMKTWIYIKKNMTNPLITVDWFMLLIIKNPGSRPATTTTTTTKRYLQTMVCIQKPKLKLS